MTNRQFTCGCYATNEDYQGVEVMLKAQDISPEGWVNTIHHVTYCDECYQKALTNGQVVGSKDEYFLWLNYLKGEK